MTNTKIRLTGDWTDPETGKAHKAGDIVVVPEYYLRLENDNGLHGRYSVDLYPAQSVRPAPLAAKASTTTNDKE